MAGKYSLGIDFGGSSSKATLLEDTGRVAATASKEYSSFYCHPGWYEQDAEELYSVLLEITREIVEKSGVSPKDIAALAVDAATHMAVFCDKDDRPLRKVIHWSDTRSTKQAEYLKREYGELIGRCSVNSVSSAWTLPQILWLQENEPEILKASSRICFLKDYLRSRITGDRCTDDIEAMGALLADDETSQWSEELCRVAGIEPSMLPDIRSPFDRAGVVSGAFAARTGLVAGTPVIVGSTDTVMEVFSSGAVEKGSATCKLATAGRICPITDGPIKSRQFFNYRHVVPGLWYPGTGTRSCAASYKWFRDVFGDAELREAAASGQSAYELLNRAAEAVPPGSEHLFFHPFLQGEMTPYFDDSLCASFVGIRSGHTKGHFARAVMEGVAFSMRDCLEEIRAREISVTQYRLIGGGAKGRLWRQILCDVLATPLVCTAENDSSKGSAMLAGIAVGLFDGIGDCVGKSVVVTDSVRPNEENAAVYERSYRLYREIVGALGGVYHHFENDQE